MNYKLIIALVSLVFTTCKKENSENYCYSDSLMSQINSGDLAVHGLTYNSNCLIYESTEPYTYQRFSYDEQNRLKKLEGAISFSAFSCVMIPGQSPESDPRKAEISQLSEFEYDEASNLIKTSNYYINKGNPQFLSYNTYDYENGRIIKLSNFNPQGLLTQYHEYKYDENGNITRDELFTNSSTLKLVQTVIYEFDSKNNPYIIFACKGTPGLYTNKNNIIKETTTVYSGTGQSSYVKQNVYKYNKFNLPNKVNDLDYKYGK
jgi:hypothetical protein